MCACVKFALLSFQQTHNNFPSAPVHGLYSQLSLNGHLNKTDTSVKRTPRVGPSLSLLPLFGSLKDPGGGGGGAHPQKSDGDAHKKNQIKPLGETNVGVAQA